MRFRFAVLFAFIPASASAMQAACVDALKERLLAPATFKLISATPSQREIPLASYYANSPNALKSAEGAGARATEFTLHITYDALNAYRVPIRGTVACTFRTTKAAPTDADRFSVKIDGKEHIEWLVEQLKSGRR